MFGSYGSILYLCIRIGCIPFPLILRFKKRYAYHDIGNLGNFQDVHVVA